MVDAVHDAKRLEELEHHAIVLEGQLSALRTRYYPDAEIFFDNKQYGLLKIVTVSTKNEDD